MKKSRKCIELFVGAGSLTLGLEQTVFDEIGLVEFAYTACETLIINRRNWNALAEAEIVDCIKIDYNFNKFISTIVLE